MASRPTRRVPVEPGQTPLDNDEIRLPAGVLCQLAMCRDLAGNTPLPVEHRRSSKSAMSPVLFLVPRMNLSPGNAHSRGLSCNPVSMSPPHQLHCDCVQYIHTHGFTRTVLITLCRQVYTVHNARSHLVTLQQWGAHDSLPLVVALVQQFVRVFCQACCTFAPSSRRGRIFRRLAQGLVLRRRNAVRARCFPTPRRNACSSYTI